MLKKQMLIRLHGVQIYRGEFVPISVDIVDHNGEVPLFNFNPEGIKVGGEDLVNLIEEMSRNGVLRIHPKSIKEF
jgi:hypothetical protein